MSEKSLVNKLRKDLEKRLTKSWWKKLPDPTVCPRCHTIAVGEKRPFDLVGCYEGMMIAIEVKTRSIKDLEPHQDAALRLVAQAGGLCAVVVNKDVYVPAGPVKWIKLSCDIVKLIRGPENNCSVPWRHSV